MKRAAFGCLLVVVAACGRSPRPTPPEPVAPAAATSAATDGRACVPSSLRCAGTSTAEQCRGDGSGWESKGCDAATTCLDGRCASLTARGTRLDAARLYALRGEGWLDAWSVSAPLGAKIVQKIAETPDDPTAGGTNATFRAVCEPEGYVSLMGGPDQRQKPPAWAVLAGWLVSGKEQQLALKAGVAGGLRVWIDGKPVLDVTRPTGGSLGKPFRDEVVVPVTLREGPNLVTAILEQNDDAPPGLWLRLHDEHNRVPDVALAPWGGERCGASDLVLVDPAARPVASGFDIDVAPRILGAFPREVGSVGGRVELNVGGTTLVDRPFGPWPVAELAGGRADAPSSRIPARILRPERPAKLDIAITVGVAGGESSTERRTVREQIPWDGEVHDRIARLASELDATEAASAAVPEASRVSHRATVERLVRALSEGETDVGWLRSRTDDAERTAEALRAGHDPYRGKTGVVYRAYRSRLDGRLQPYVVFVPRSYKPDGKAVPLILGYHGQNRLPEHALRTIVGEAPDDRTSIDFAGKHLPPFADQGAILAAPGGYGNAGPRTIGEDDVLRVIEEVRAAYRIDERRVSLTGYSLGGTVAFVVPLHYPDLFSGAAPLCGYPNLTGYETVRGVPHKPWEDVLLTKRYIVNYAENGLHLPLHIVHGGQDGPARSQVVADRYEALGYKRIFDVQDELDHNVWDYAYEKGRMIEWLKARRRPAVPDHVRLVTGEYRYDHAYWVRLVAMRENNDLASIDASLDRKDEGVHVTTSNVAAFALDFSHFEHPPKRLVVDGATLELGDRKEAFLDRSGGAWALLDRETDRRGKKRPGVAGPLDDVLRHPILVVYGTLRPDELETNRMVAEHFSSFDAFAGARFPIKADTEVGDGELTGRSLVLVGGPASNKVTATLAADLPVRFEPGAVVLRGKRYEGAEVGVSFIAPSPRDPDQYVVVHGGVGWRGTLLSRHLPQLSPDWVVYDAGVAEARGELLLGKRKVLDAGFFADDWK